MYCEIHNMICLTTRIMTAWWENDEMQNVKKCRSPFASSERDNHEKALVHCGQQVALDQVFLRVFRFSPASYHSTDVPYSFFHLSFNGYRRSFHWGQTRHSPPSSGEVKNEWSHTSTPLAHFHGVSTDDLTSNTDTAHNKLATDSVSQ